MSWTPFDGFDGSRALASESKATSRPSMLSAGAKLSPSPCAPLVDTIRVVVLATTSWTNTSAQGMPPAVYFLQFVPLVSLGTSELALDQKATNRPSALIVESEPTTVLPLVPVAWAPPLWTLAWWMEPVSRSF